MELMLNSITPPYSTAALIQYNNDAPSAETKIKKYELLLYKIAMSFGFGDKESSDLVQQVNSHANRYWGRQENGNSYRILLSKIIVQKCIFRISSKYFSSNNLNEEK